MLIEKRKTMGTKRKYVLPLIIIIALIAIVGGLVIWKKATTPKSDIKIGYISALSGDAGTWGQSLKKGFDFALNEINTNGGIDGRKVTVIYEDDKCDANTGLTAFNKAIDIDGVKYITGTVCSSVAMSAASKTQENRVLYVASGATNPDVPKQGDLIFRLWPSDSYDASESAKYMISNLGLKKLSVIAMADNPAGVAIKDGFKNTATSLGAQVVSEEMVNSTDSDIKTQITKIISANPEGIYIASLPEQTVLLLNQLKSANYNGKIFIYSSSALSAGFADKINDKKDMYHMSPVSIKETAFWSNYKEKTGEDPDMLIALGYDSMKMIGDGIKKCGEDNDCIRDVFLKAKDYQTTRGKINFDKDGDIGGLKYEVKAL